MRAIKVVAVTNDVFETEKKHYITIFVRCEMVDEKAEPQVSCRERSSEGMKLTWVKVLEPQKCEGWYWKNWDYLKEILNGGREEKLFLPLVNLIGQTSDLEALRS